MKNPHENLASLVILITDEKTSTRELTRVDPKAYGHRPWLCRLSVNRIVQSFNLSYSSEINRLWLLSSKHFSGFSFFPSKPPHFGQKSLVRLVSQEFISLNHWVVRKPGYFWRSNQSSEAEWGCETAFIFILSSSVLQLFRCLQQKLRFSAVHLAKVKAANISNFLVTA